VSVQVERRRHHPFRHVVCFDPEVAPPWERGSETNVSEQKEQASRPGQQQNRQPGLEYEMQPRPRAQDGGRHCSQKLEGKIALITGGDSGIGRAIAIAFAQEGADVVIVYLNEHEDAKETERLVTSEHRRCLTIAGDVGDEEFCKDAVEKTILEFGRLDILINNAADQHPQKRIEDISAAQLQRTFRTNVFSFFYMAKAALQHLREGSSIINTTSVTDCIQMERSSMHDRLPQTASSIRRLGDR
jgi:hypothetical protein